MCEFKIDNEVPEEDREVIQAFLKRVPENQMIDPIVYRQILVAHHALEILLEKNGTPAEIELEFHPVFSSASLSVEIPALVVADMDLFVKVFCFASTLSFYPLLNGNIKFDLSFDKAMIPI